MRRKLSKGLFTLTIRTPIMAFFLFISMIIVVTAIAYNSKIDVYVDKTGVIQKGESQQPVITVKLSEQEYAKIKKDHDVKWYFDRNDHIYSTQISEVQKNDNNHVLVLLSVTERLDDYNSNKEVQVEFYSREERVIHSLVSR